MNISKNPNNNELDIASRQLVSKEEGLKTRCEPRPKTKDKLSEKSKRSDKMSSKKAKMTKGEDVDSITNQMKELVKMNMMIQNKLASLENNLSEAKKKGQEEAEDDFELSEDAVEQILERSSNLSKEVLEENSDDDDIVELPKEDKEKVASELVVDISMDEEEDELTMEEKAMKDVSIEEDPKEDILDRESRELLESESFEDVKEDLVEEKKEIKEEDDDMYIGHQMDEDEEEEAKFNVEVKEEKVDPTELNMAPGWKVKFGKGRNSNRFLKTFYPSSWPLIIHPSSLHHHHPSSPSSSSPCRYLYTSPCGKVFHTLISAVQYMQVIKS